MTARAAVCYVASQGHLFQTSLSAIQARGAVDGTTEVVVVFLTRGASTSEEAAHFGRALRSGGVRLETRSEAELAGLGPTFGRFLLDRALPPSIDRIVYLDGDTQIVGDLSPLVAEDPGPGGVAACLDPMVLLHRVHPVHRRTIDRWWDRSGLDLDTRSRYVNSGVMVLDRSALAGLARRVRHHALAHQDLVFPDQDALNVVVGGQARLLSMRWNFPGFLLGTAVEDAVSPHVVHFMSRPRPWNAPLPPWGRRFYTPYEELAASHPALARYWPRFGTAATLRYTAQQALKGLTERRLLSRSGVGDVVRTLEARTAAGGPAS